ncbi:MAG: hypothetical protein ACI350_06800 [Prevotella sp.]
MMPYISFHVEALFFPTFPSTRKRAPGIVPDFSGDSRPYSLSAQELAAE